MSDSLTVIVLLWHYKQKEKQKAWATVLLVLASALVGGVMIAILLAIVKTKDAVSFLHNIEKSLKSESSLRTNVVREVKTANATSYYKMDESFYWHKYKKILQNLQHVKVNRIS